MYLKSLAILVKASVSLEKAKISLRMSSKKILIFKNAPRHYKKPQIL
jgi:hypothetical protein